MFCFTCTSGIVFECKFQTLMFYSSDKFYTCYSTVINSGNKELEEIHGKHEDPANSSTVEAFYSKNRVLEKLPKNLASFFPNLKIIACFSTTLSEINLEDLKPFPNLKYLSLPRNNLIKLSSNLFKFTPKIQGITFANNQLQCIGKNLLDDLTDLKWADFQSNSCINGYAEGAAGIKQLNLELPTKCSLEETKPNDKEDCELITSKCLLDEDITSLQHKLDNILEDLKDLKLELHNELNFINADFIENKMQKHFRITDIETMISELLSH